MTEEAWKTYEEVATYLLNKIASEFNVDRFEGKQTITGYRSGTIYEIDAKGARDNDSIFLIVECRRYTTSKQNQEKIGGLAYRIIDTRAAGGIIVTPMGLQEGARKIAAAENIYSVVLDPRSTKTDYILKFLNQFHAGISEKIRFKDSISAKIIHADGTIEEIGPIDG